MAAFDNYWCTVIVNDYIKRIDRTIYEIDKNMRQTDFEHVDQAVEYMTICSNMITELKTLRNTIEGYGFE